jgi:hypothetical protein
MRYLNPEADMIERIYPDHPYAGILFLPQARRKETWPGQASIQQQLCLAQVEQDQYLTWRQEIKHDEH